VSFLIDTNVLLRFFELQDPKNAEIVNAFNVLRNAAEPSFTCAQVLIEYWVSATRPLDANGFGLDCAQADMRLGVVQSLFPCLPEPPDMAERWRKVVSENAVRGRQAHDARIAALMLAHGVTHLVTLNPTDFTRYDGITPVTPQDILHR